MPTMPAAIATGLKQLRCDEIPIPDPEPGMVLVRTELASICGSDLHICYMGWNVYEWPLPHGYPGHEGVGVVVDGSDTDFQEGEVVLTAPNIWSSRTFAGYQLIDPKFLLRLPADVPLAHLLMAQQLGTVVFGCQKLPSLVGKTVAVVGQGSVGLFHDFMLRRIGAHRIIAIEPVPERLEHARRMGADDVIDVTGQRATDAVMDLTNGEGADLVIEAVGSIETLNQSLKLVKPLGRIAVFGLPPHDGARTLRLGTHSSAQRLRLTHGVRRTGRTRPARVPARRGLHPERRIDYGAVLSHTSISSRAFKEAFEPRRRQRRRRTGRCR